jgi:hypothetical protein
VIPATVTARIKGGGLFSESELPPRAKSLVVETTGVETVWIMTEGFSLGVLGERVVGVSVVARVCGVWGTGRGRTLHVGGVEGSVIGGVMGEGWRVRLRRAKWFIVVLDVCGPRIDSRWPASRSGPYVSPSLPSLSLSGSLTSPWCECE